MFGSNLSLGDTSGEVRLLQEKLQALGYFPADVSPSGYFGPVTASAVKAFQQANGIETVGAVGPKTRAVLNQL